MKHTEVEKELRPRKWRKPVISVLKVPGWTGTGTNFYDSDEDNLVNSGHIAQYRPSPP